MPQYILTVVYDDTIRYNLHTDYEEAIERFRDLQEELPHRQEMKAVYLSFLMHEAQG